MRLPRIASVLLMLTFVSGCSPYVRKPNFFHPGPAGPQQTDAIYHDPYPLDDVAPPITGGRPREYQRPVPEVVRGRLLDTQPAIVQPQFTLPIQPTQPGF